MQIAHYNLDEVKALIAGEAFVLTRTKALLPVMKHCGSPQEARKYVATSVAALEALNFCETLQMRFDQKFDVYGLRQDEKTWYIKFAVDLDNTGEDQVLIVSFHEANREIRTRGGVLKP